MSDDLRNLLTWEFPVVDGVHVAEADDAHAASFTDEWNRWATTQVDSKGYRCGYDGCRNSADIFAKKTSLAGKDLAGKVVLDAGCGTGRFAEIAAKAGARVVAVDLSAAVFHAAKLAPEWKTDALFVKTNLERLPIRDACVDVVYSIGVLHHCAAPARAVAEIARVLRPGGAFAGWVYMKQGSYGHRMRSMWRAWSTSPGNRPALLALVEAAPRLRDLYAASDINGVRAAVADMGRHIPVLPTIFGLAGPQPFREIVGISGSANDDECRLDTFDWSTPQYQWQHTWEEWLAVLKASGFLNASRLEFPISWRAGR